MSNRPLLSIALMFILCQDRISGAVAFTSVFIPRSVGTWATRNVRLSSSVGDNDDEISKLIGKRNQIKRKKREDMEKAASEQLEPILDLDLDKLPEFKTERPVRRAKQESEPEEEEEEEKDKKKKSAESPIVDFKADYDDENDFHVPNRIAVTTVSWGDPARNFVAGGEKKLTKRMIKAGKFVAGDAQLAHTKLLEGGITLIESSPTYGSASASAKLSALDILKRCLDEQDSSLPETAVMVSMGSSAWSKLLQPAKSVGNELDTACGKLGMEIVDLFQMPKPMLFPSAMAAKALAACIESGQCNYVGVQGVTSGSKLRKLVKKLESLEVTLTSNSFDFSLTNRKNEAMIGICKAANVIPFVTDPLDGGLASGVYTAANPSGGSSAPGGTTKFTFKELEKLQPLHSVLETVAERVRTRVIREMRDTQERYKSRYGPPPKINTDITTTQVSLNYVVFKGGVPLVEVNNPQQAEEVLGSLGWSLTSEEVDMLDAAAALCKL